MVETNSTQTRSSSSLLLPRREVREEASVDSLLSDEGERTRGLRSELSFDSLDSHMSGADPPVSQKKKFRSSSSSSLYRYTTNGGQSENSIGHNRRNSGSKRGFYPTSHVVKINPYQSSFPQHRETLIQAAIDTLLSDPTSAPASAR